MSGAARPAARLAIVVPVYGHPVLVSEALESALAQEAPFGIHIVVVNDGCPQPETHQVLQAYAHAHPDRLSYLRRPNGGLSAARNTGIAHVLAHLPQVEAIFMLDADNRLRPRAMARAMATLDAHPEAGWIYPGIEMFGQGYLPKDLAEGFHPLPEPAATALHLSGMAARCDYGGPYSRLIHSQMNICEAGSLIRCAVFEAGIFFDESFTEGFEDWHFFLSAGDAGFRGQYLEEFGFLYRKRPESMLATADRNIPRLVERLRRAHPDLYHPRTQLQLEHTEAPRYALWIADEEVVLLCTDPADPAAAITPAEYIRSFWASRTLPVSHRCPPWLVVLTRPGLDALQAAGILHWLLWQMEGETAPDQASLVHTTRPQGPARLGISTLTAPPNALLKGRAALWMLGADALAALAANPEAPRIPTTTLILTTPAAIPNHPPKPLHKAAQALHASPYRQAGAQRWNWRQGSVGWRGREYRILRQAFGGQPVLPRLPRQAPQIGVITQDPGAPALHTLIAALQPRRESGAALHLHVMDREADLAGLGSQLDSLTLLGRAGFATDTPAQGPQPRFFNGLPLPRAASPALDDRAMAQLCTLSEAHIIAAPGALRLLAALRSHKIRTILHLAPQNPGASPDLTLARAYEHVCDAIIAPDPATAAYLRAMGLPAAKISGLSGPEPPPDCGIPGTPPPG